MKAKVIPITAIKFPSTKMLGTSLINQLKWEKENHGKIPDSQPDENRR